MEQPPYAGVEDFTEQFTAVLCTSWSEILYVLNRQSPRLAALLAVSRPLGMKRVKGGWQVRVIVRRVPQPDKIHQPRDNEIVAHAIRSWARSTAQLDLPPLTVAFDL